VLNQPRQTLAKFHELSSFWRRVLLSLVHGFGTVYQLLCVMLTLRWVNSNDSWRHVRLFLVTGLKDEKPIKKQTYMKTETCKLCVGVIWIFLPNVIKIDPYNFELYQLKVTCMRATSKKHYTLRMHRHTRDTWCYTSRHSDKTNEPSFSRARKQLSVKATPRDEFTVNWCWRLTADIVTTGTHITMTRLVKTQGPPSQNFLWKS